MTPSAGPDRKRPLQVLGAYPRVSPWLHEPTGRKNGVPVSLGPMLPPDTRDLYVKT
jgi:hypothetical protein